MAMTVAGERIADRLRRMVFEAMMKQEMAFFDSNKTGDLVNRLASDVLLVQRSLTLSVASVRTFVTPSKAMCQRVV
jgi:ABC-type multidrug transport system fused ATPase/permease subunit